MDPTNPMKTHVALSALSLAILSVTASPASAAATWDASTSLHRFDAKVALGLPQRAFSIRATNEAGIASRGRLSVDSRLDTVTGLPDGSAIVTYLGRWNEHPATISHGDGQLLVDTDEPQATTTPENAVARFDTAIATGMPTVVPLVPLNDELVVLGAFGGDIIFADGRHGQMYDATWHGAPVVATRSGNHLDITSLSSGGVGIIGFTAGSTKVEHETLPAMNGSVDASATMDTVTSAALRIASTTDDSLSPGRLTFHLMLHDDLGDTTSQHVHAGYVAWWLADLQRNIVPGKKVDVLYSELIPGVTDVRYRYVGSLHDWSDVIANYAQEQNIPRTYKHKFMLIVRGMPEPERYGRSWQKGSDGIASINGRYSEVAHQLGHLLGAKHANAEVRFGRWWCETNMYTPSLLLRSNCYGYSRTNMRLIDEYIRTGQGFIADSRWSEDR